MDAFIEALGQVIEWSGDVMFTSIKSTIISVLVISALIGLWFLVF